LSISSLKNRINKRIRLDDYKSDFQEIGSFIKKKRKELNVTQDVISNGICSVSYLSKIENNQIVPNEYYVKEIMGKLDVEDSYYQKTSDDKLYLNSMIKGIFYLDDDLVIEVFNEVKEIKNNLVINICKLGYYVYFNKEDENQYVMMLENLVNNMTDLELKAYLFFSSIYFISKEKYKTALEVLFLCNKIQIPNEYLLALTAGSIYLVKQRLLMKNSSSDDFEIAQKIFNKYHNKKRAVNLELWKTYYLIKENPEKAMKILEKLKENTTDEYYRDFYYLLKAEVLFEYEVYNECILSLSKIGSNSKLFYRKMILLYKVCKIENDLGMLEEIKTILLNYKPDKFQLQHKVYYHYLLLEKEGELKEYLRDIAIPFSIEIEDIYGLEEYTNNVMDICINTSRYKEATQFYKKFQKEVGRISKVCFD